MIKLSRMADYAVVLMTQLAREPDTLRTAGELAQSCGLPQPTVSKILKLLAQAGLLVSYRGNKGGYLLAREADGVTMADVIGAVDGPIALTDCIGPDGLVCEIEALCPTRTNWQSINRAMVDALSSVSLAEMAVPHAAFADRAPVGARAE
ncbi:MAG: SUF system Fe-S cluster assembly regulator [Defluviicoccus sp.]|nr:SUF system Fe-S cluster assembly regulator [Defluviicoccus sp.]